MAKATTGQPESTYRDFQTAEAAVRPMTLNLLNEVDLSAADAEHAGPEYKALREAMIALKKAEAIHEFAKRRNSFAGKKDGSLLEQFRIAVDNMPASQQIEDSPVTSALKAIDASGLDSIDVDMLEIKLEQALSDSNGGLTAQKNEASRIKESLEAQLSGRLGHLNAQVDEAIKLDTYNSLTNFALAEVLMTTEARTAADRKSRRTLEEGGVPEELRNMVEIDDGRGDSSLQGIFVEIDKLRVSNDVIVPRNGIVDFENAFGLNLYMGPEVITKCKTAVEDERERPLELGNPTDNDLLWRYIVEGRDLESEISDARELEIAKKKRALGVVLNSRLKRWKEGDRIGIARSATDEIPYQLIPSKDAEGAIVLSTDIEQGLDSTIKPYELLEKIIEDSKELKATIKELEEDGITFIGFHSDPTSNRNTAKAESKKARSDRASAKEVVEDKLRKLRTAVEAAGGATTNTAVIRRRVDVALNGVEGLISRKEEANLLAALTGDQFGFETGAAQLLIDRIKTAVAVSTTTVKPAEGASNAKTVVNTIKRAVEKKSFESLTKKLMSAGIDESEANTISDLLETQAKSSSGTLNKLPTKWARLVYVATILVSIGLGVLAMHLLDKGPDTSGNDEIEALADQFAGRIIDAELSDQSPEEIRARITNADGILGATDVLVGAYEAQVEALEAAQAAAPATPEVPEALQIELLDKIGGVALLYKGRKLGETSIPKFDGDTPSEEAIEAVQSELENQIGQVDDPLARVIELMKVADAAEDKRLEEKARSAGAASEKEAWKVHWKKELTGVALPR